jgi:molybdopterin molybdotransferase
VAIISSGDEVVPINQRPRPGQVRDINSHALAALVTAAGGQAGLLGIAGDDMKALTALISDALAWADVILVSGGSSAGQRDYTVRAMQSVGAEILAHGVAVKPGKPLIMARKEHRSLWGLPGHTTGALICAEVFIRPLLRKLSGAQEKPIRNKTLKAVLDRSVQSAQGRRDYICARLHTDPDGTLTAVPIMGKSGLIAALVEADALIICPEDQEGLAADQIVDVLLF